MNIHEYQAKEILKKFGVSVPKGVAILDLKEGIVIAYTIVENKIGIAVGITKNLEKKFDAVELVKIGSSAIGGKGGGGRKDFAQAGGNDTSKIKESFSKIIKTIVTILIKFSYS